MRPIYILSLPRSGSTLAQKILGSHTEISTVPEPWLLLPYLYTLKHGESYTDYSHSTLVKAIEDFCENLPRGRNDYLDEIKSLTLRLYSKAATKECRYFLDKTPRYHLITEEIISLFKDAKFILIWRNPLAVVSSTMQTWANNKWNLHHFKIDLFNGVENLVSTYEKHQDKILALRYEDIINKPETSFRMILEHLDLPFEESMLENYHETRLDGRMGDPLGVKNYNSIAPSSLNKWQTNLANPLRKTWCKRYLKWIGKKRLDIMGYDMESLMEQLDTHPTTFDNFFSDVLRATYGTLYCAFETKLIREKIKILPDWHKIHPHS